MSRRSDITAIACGTLRDEPILLIDRHFGAFAGHHYSGGDDILRADIEAGRVTYWTIVEADTYMTACGGRRWRTRQHAERWLAPERAWLAQDEVAS